MWVQKGFGVVIVVVDESDYLAPAMGIRFDSVVVELDSHLVLDFRRKLNNWLSLKPETQGSIPFCCLF
jgi:hypothetical protein